MSKKITTDEFIVKSKTIHGNKYDYSLVNYKKSKEKVIIKCHIHGYFNQTPSNHTHVKHPQGCPYCCSTRKSDKSKFIEKARKIHGNKYDYSLFVYERNNVKSTIICSVHGEFDTTPSSHLVSKHGCIDCYHDSRRKIKQKFISESNIIHNNKYNYDYVNYFNNQRKVIIVCPIHGNFKQTPNTHTNGKGCPKCHDDVPLIDKSLYLLYDKKTQLYKIGHSKNIKKRVKSIEELIQYKIKIVNIYKQCAIKERFIHKIFKHKRKNHPIKHGGYTKWFLLNGDDVKNIDELIKF